MLHTKALVPLSSAMFLLAAVDMKCRWQVCVGVSGHHCYAAAESHLTNAYAKQQQASVRLDGDASVV